MVGNFGYLDAELLGNGDKVHIARGLVVQFSNRNTGNAQNELIQAQ